MIVSPNSETFVHLKSVNKLTLPDLVMCSPLQRIASATGIVGGRSLVMPQNNTVPFLFVNPSNVSVKLHAGQKVASADSVQSFSNCSLATPSGLSLSNPIANNVLQEQNKKILVTS